MIVPSRIKNPDVVYDCTLNTLKVAQSNNINAIVLPAFGGACGGLLPAVISKKMHKAYFD